MLVNACVDLHCRKALKAVSAGFIASNLGAVFYLMSNECKGFFGETG